MNDDNLINMTSLSIIIPTYNSEKTLPCALESIITQDFTDYEILIMDGLSTDDTVSIAESFNDPRIHVYSEPDKGIYDAMNKGIKKAQGEWLYFLGSDDWLLNNRVLNDVMSFAKDGKYDVVYCDVESKGLVAQGYGEWNYDILMFNRCHQGIFHKKHVFDICGLYNLKYWICADHDKNLSWFFNKRITSVYYPYTVAHFSECGVSSNDKNDVAFWNDFDWLLLKYGFRKLPLRRKLGCIKRLLIKKCFHR